MWWHNSCSIDMTSGRYSVISNGSTHSSRAEVITFIILCIILDTISLHCICNTSLSHWVVFSNKNLMNILNQSGRIPNIDDELNFNWPQWRRGRKQCCDNVANHPLSQQAVFHHATRFPWGQHRHCDNRQEIDSRLNLLSISKICGLVCLYIQSWHILSQE